MYTPKSYRLDNIEEVQSLIEAHNFAILINTVDDRPWATHIPLSLSHNDSGDDLLIGHIAKANQQWKYFSEDREVLAVFSGPQTYISSSWYDHESAPTWNYSAVHVYGKISIISEKELRDHLKTLMQQHEKKMNQPVNYDDMSHQYIEREIKNIVGFEIKITEIQATAKYSQDKDKKNFDNITQHLEQSNKPNDQAVAKTMKQRKNKK